jgi:hypothetical protein
MMKPMIALHDVFVMIVILAVGDEVSYAREVACAMEGGDVRT